MDLIREIEEGLKKPGKSRKGLAEALGRTPATVTEMLKQEGKRRQIKANEVPVIRAYLELEPGIPIIGWVGAGADAHFYNAAADAPSPDYVPAPANTPPGTVGVEIRGDSLGKTYNGWVAIYGARQDGLPDNYRGELCVLWLADDRVLIKQARPSRIPGQYHLTSDFSEPIMDVEIEYSARVLGIVRKP